MVWYVFIMDWYGFLWYNMVFLWIRMVFLWYCMGFFVDWHGDENIGHGMAWHDFALYKCTFLHGLLINLNFQCRFKYYFSDLFLSNVSSS